MILSLLLGEDTRCVLVFMLVVMVKVKELISLFLYLMKGSYDDKLEQLGYWPLRGAFKIELLDQLNDDNYVYNISYNSSVPSCHTDRV